MAKKPKNIHLDEEVIQKLSVQAAEKGKLFKPYVEDILTRLANHRPASK